MQRALSIARSLASPFDVPEALFLIASNSRGDRYARSYGCVQKLEKLVCAERCFCGSEGHEPGVARLDVQALTFGRLQIATEEPSLQLLMTAVQLLQRAPKHRLIPPELLNSGFVPRSCLRSRAIVFPQAVGKAVVQLRRHEQFGVPRAIEDEMSPVTRRRGALSADGVVSGLDRASSHTLVIGP